MDESSCVGTGARTPLRGGKGGADGCSRAPEGRRNVLVAAVDDAGHTGLANASGSGAGYTYVGNGSQTAKMSKAKCMDVFLDWGTNGGHYDGRVVRSCRPGYQEMSDPGGDGYWSEPSDWGGRSVHGLQRGFGVMIDDGTLQVLKAARLPGAGTVGVGTHMPGTGTQGYARVRTRYQNGSVKSCNPLPVDSPDGSGGCS